jgi:hypothetical protein
MTSSYPRLRRIPLSLISLYRSPPAAHSPQSHRADPRYLTTHYPSLNLITEAHTANDHPAYPSLIVAQKEDEPLLESQTDLVITLGGDGTILHTSHLFGAGECPPVLSFSMGSLGFLLPFRKSHKDLGVVSAVGLLSFDRPKRRVRTGTDTRHRRYGERSEYRVEGTCLCAQPDAPCMYDCWGGRSTPGLRSVGYVESRV